MKNALICDHCGEPIGVYEPSVFVRPDGVQTGSLAAAPELAEVASERYHASCVSTRGVRPGGSQPA